MGEFDPVVSVTQTIDASPSQVWETVTHRTGVMFMGSEIETDWHQGHAITFKGEWKGKTFKDKGTVETFQEEKKLAFTHFSSATGKPDSAENYNLVSIDLEPKGTKTNVTLTQSKHHQAPKPSAEAVSEFEKNWRMMLGNLKDAAEQDEKRSTGTAP